MKYSYDEKFEGIISEPDCADEYMSQILLIGIDYDGCSTVEDLKNLIDELIVLSVKARNCLRDGKIFTNEEESERSYKSAKEEQRKCEEDENKRKVNI